MKVLVRIRKSSFIQQWFFGGWAPRPYLAIEGVDDEDEIREVIKAYIDGNEKFLKNYRIKVYMKPVSGEFEYVPITSFGFGKAVYLGLIE